MGDLRSRWIRYAGVCALLAATVLLVLLSFRYRALGEDYRELRRRALYPHVGIFFPRVEAETVVGESIVLGDPEPNRSDVLVFFDTTCPYCRASLPAWRELTERAGRSGSFRVVGVSLDPRDSTRIYARRHELPYPVVSLEERRLVELYRARRVPLVVVVEEGGRVRFARPGALEGGAALDSVVAAAERSYLREGDSVPAGAGDVSSP